LKKAQHFFFLLASSNTSLVTRTLSIRPLPSRKVDCLESMTLYNTFFLLRDNNFEIILYKHPTKEMDLKSPSSCGFLDLGTKQIKEAFDPVGQEPETTKSFTAKRISFFNISQLCLMKLKLKPSRPGLFELSQLHIVFLTSS